MKRKRGSISSEVQTASITIPTHIYSVSSILCCISSQKHLLTDVLLFYEMYMFFGVISLSLSTVIFITSLVFVLQVLKGTGRDSQTWNWRKCQRVGFTFLTNPEKKERIHHTFNNATLSNVHQQQGAVNVSFKSNVKFSACKWQTIREKKKKKEIKIQLLSVFFS